MRVIRRDKPTTGILWSEIHFDGAREAASRFVLRLDPTTLTKRTSAATFAHAEDFRIAVGIHPAKQEIVVFLGKNDGGREIRQSYVMPGTSDGTAPHELETLFAEGKILRVVLDRQPLEKRE